MKLFLFALFPALLFGQIQLVPNVPMPEARVIINNNFAYLDSKQLSGTTLPANCTVGQIFLKTNAPAGQNTYAALATGSPCSWTLQGGTGGGGAGLADPGSNGLIKRTAVNITAAAVPGTDFQLPLGFTAENVANKDTDVALTANSDTRYPSQKAVRAFVVANGGITDPGANGIMKRTALNVTAPAVAGIDYPTGAGPANAVQSTNGSGALTDSGCTATAGQITCPSGFVSTSSSPTVITMNCGAAPGTPATGKAADYCDSTAKGFSVKNDAGVVQRTVQPTDCTSVGAVQKINPDGTVGCAAGGGGSQTPWTGDIDGAGHALNNAGSIFLSNHLEIKAQAGTVADIALTSPTGLLRWSFGKGTDTETGTGNTGSYFKIARYADDGSLLGAILSIKRSTNGPVTFYSPVGLGAVEAPAYPLDVAGDVNITGTYRVNGTPISGGGGSAAAGTVYTQSFTSQTSVALAHNMALSPTTAFTAQCFNATGNVLIPANVAATDLNTVTVTFGGAETGSCTINGGGGAHFYSATMSSASTWTVAGTTHKLGTCDLTVMAWDAATGVRHKLVPADISCDDTAGAYTVTVSFGAAQAGRLVLVAAK